MKQLEIQIPTQVKINKLDQTLIFSNISNESNLKISKLININIKDNLLILIPRNEHSKIINKKLLGLYKKLIQNLIKGLSQNFKIVLNLNGIGFKANLINQELVFKLGFSHPVILKIPTTIKVQIFKSTQIVLSGHNLNEVTQFAHNIKKFKKPDSYKGKGILLTYEKPVSIKEGKRNKR